MTDMLKTLQDCLCISLYERAALRRTIVQTCQLSGSLFIAYNRIQNSVTMDETYLLSRIPEFVKWKGRYESGTKWSRKQRTASENVPCIYFGMRAVYYSLHILKKEQLWMMNVMCHFCSHWSKKFQKKKKARKEALFYQHIARQHLKQQNYMNLSANCYPIHCIYQILSPRGSELRFRTIRLWKTCFRQNNIWII